ncbi:hypothetical protein PAEAM_61660 [Paenibacillus sp. GM1FR]|nr:hypothetical protein PAEAM_61660 [Paenibacillus sp. GM1FR]
MVSLLFYGFYRLFKKSAFDYEGCLTASSASNMKFSRNVRGSRSFPYAPLLHF